MQVRARVAWVRPLGEALGGGLVAGTAGTALMTASSAIESRLRDREPSAAPAEAAGRVLGVEPRDDATRQRFATVVHWGYGMGWGAARGMLDFAGVVGRRATLAHMAAVWGTALVMLPALDVAPAPWEWGGRDLAIDALHHAVYAVGTGVAYERLRRT